MIIYYGIDDHKCDTGIRAVDPCPVNLQYFGDKNNTRANFNLCPAYQAYVKNMFYIPARFDYNLYYDKEINSYKTDYYDQEFYDALVECRDFNTAMFSFHLFNYFITETTSLEVETFSANFYKNGFTDNTIMIPGKFDIGKWIRPIELPFYFKNKIEIKEGDPLFFIKFNTKEKIIFKRFLITEKFTSLLNYSLNIKQFKNTGPLKLKRLYDIYSKYPKLKKKIIEEAKNNLIN